MKSRLIILPLFLVFASCSSKFIKQNTPEVETLNSSIKDYNLICTTEIKNEKTQNSCNDKIIEEIKICLERSYNLVYNKLSNSTLIFNYELVQGDSTNLPLSISFITLGLIPISTNLYEESLSVSIENNKKTGVLKSNFLLQAGWYYYFNNLFSKKIDTCEKIKSLLQNKI